MSRFARFARGFALLLPLAMSPAAADEAPAGAVVQQPANYETVTGKLLKKTADRLVVQQLGGPDQGKKVRIAGNAKVPVAGLKESWAALSPGDAVTVTYEAEGAARTAVKVDVKRPKDLPVVAQLLGKPPPAKRRGRSFTGWIKEKTDERIVVRTPDGEPPNARKGEAIAFVRTEDTAVSHLRSSWAELKKGDRVTVSFAKGRPRPAKQVIVVLRGGEKPLPPGLATRLYDPTYDKTVKDVDGIGEVPAGAVWTPPAAEPAKPAAETKPAEPPA